MKSKIAVKKINKTDIDYFRSRIVNWGRKNFAHFPWRKTSNLWHCLVVEIMLQRTRAEQVVPVFKNFCKDCKTPFQYAKKKKYSVFKTLGLPQREGLLRKLAIQLSRGKIPKKKEELLKLSGVGEYISAAYRSLHLGIRDVIIDSNVVRVYGRFFGFKTDGETRRKKWFVELAERMTPQRVFTDYNYGLIDFTREICKPKPLCEQCIIRKKCKYSNKQGYG